MSTFADLGVPDALVAALKKTGITEPFPVQAAAIPDALAGLDVCGKAPTGSGKTLAFGLPTLVNVDKAQKLRPRALILAPTRELAQQIKDELMPLARAVNRFVMAVYGGVGYGHQKADLRRGVDVLVATPGRLEDLIEQNAVQLRDVDVVVVDEADRMADMGFLPPVRRILDQTASDRQTLLFSATLDGDVATLIRDYQDNPVQHEAVNAIDEEVDAEHHFWLVDHTQRIRHTAEIVEHTGRSIVFTRTRRGADRLVKQLEKQGLDAVAMHGGRSQSQRNRALKAFSNGNAKALVATDVAARGIHVDSVACVIHYDVPADHKDYVHRSGRTGRAGASGTVVSLVTREHRRAVGRIQKDLGISGPFADPDLSALAVGTHEAPRPAAADDRSGGRRQTRRSEGRDGGRAQGRNGSSRPRSDRDRGDSRGDRPERSDRDAGTSRPKHKKKGRKVESIYVANIPWGADQEDLTALFERHGTVHETTIVTDRKTGRSRGFGFVDMEPDDAKQALKHLQGAKLDGRPITVRSARPRPERRNQRTTSRH